MLPIPVPTSLTFFLEIIVPGLLGSVLAYPLLPEWARVETGPAGLGGFAAISIGIGFIPFLLRTLLFDFAFGRYWLQRHREYAIRRLQERVDQARTDLAKAVEGGLPRPSTLVDAFWKQRLLDMTMVTGPDRARTVYAPTVIGNGYLSIVSDLAEHFEVEEQFKGNRLAALQVASAVTRGWFLLPKEIRTEIAESGAAGVALTRSAVIAAGVAVLYLARYAFIATTFQKAMTDLLLAGIALFASRVAYVAAVTETYSMLQTVRNLLVPLDRDTVHAFRELVRAQTQAAAQGQAPPPSSPAIPPSGVPDSRDGTPKT